MALLTCPLCRGRGWNTARPPAMCTECVGRGHVLGPAFELPRFSSTHVRRWRRGTKREEERWLVVCDYADATIRYTFEDHPTLPGLQVLLEAYEPDYRSRLYSDDIRYYLRFSEDDYLVGPDGECALAVERAVLEWHNSRGHSRERYCVLMETEEWDEGTHLSLEFWDCQPFGVPFPDAEETA